MTDRGHWARQLLAAIGAPATWHNRYAVVAWETAEGTTAKFNPLATTKLMPGSTPFNTTGVQNYTSLESGVLATASTLKESGHGYEPILKHLRANDAAHLTLEAVKDSAWGTGALALKILPDVKQDYQTYASKEIGQ